jgi:HEAT repeat protein
VGNESREALPMRQTATIALGMLADADEDAQDVEVRETLIATLHEDSDQPTRYYAAMGLAQAGSRPGGASLDPQRLASSNEVREILIRRLGSGSETERAWSALALGVFEYRMRQAGENASQNAQSALLGILQHSRSPEVGAATSLALGLCGAVDAKVALIEQLKSGEANVRSFAALALGMIGAKEAQPALEKLLERSEGAPEQYVPISEALAMLGVHAGDRLVESIGNGLSLEAQLAACVALGRTGGSRAVQPLTDMVGDSSGTTWVRAMAVEALGSIGDHGAVRWNASYGFDLNFLALPLTATAPTLDGVLDLE